MRAEIKKHAWEQIANAGASALSLNATAKRLGMSGPALYRYFAGHDEPITELIRDADRSLADTFHAAAADGADITAHALRDWALADPQRYFLVYGTPVPGHHTPEDVTGITREIMSVLFGACAAPSDGDTPAATPSTHTSPPTGSGPTPTRPHRRLSAAPSPSGPVSTGRCPWNSRATSPAWASIRPSCTQRSRPNSPTRPARTPDQALASLGHPGTPAGAPVRRTEQKRPDAEPEQLRLVHAATDAVDAVDGFEAATAARPSGLVLRAARP